MLLVGGLSPLYTSERMSLDSNAHYINEVAPFPPKINCHVAISSMTHTPTCTLQHCSATADLWLAENPHIQEVQDEASSLRC